MLKIGIIGVGRIGKVHGESISRHVKNAEIKAVADPFLSKEAISWARNLNISGIYNDYHKILENPEIDAVLICSSTNTHFDISMEAIRAGKHVFCEKPVDLNIARIKEVIDEIKKTKVKYQVGFNRRFDHNFMALRQGVSEGKIGQPHVIKITSRDPNPPSIDYIKGSGGLFLDMAVHDFDMVRFLSGSEVTEVFASGNVLVDKAIGEQGDIDTAIVTLKLTNGCLAAIDNSRKACYGYDQRAEVFGSKGLIAISNDTQSSAVFSNENGVTSEKPLYFFLDRYMPAYAAEITDFVNTITSNKEVSVGAYDGLQSVVIGLAAKKSLAENRPVKLTEIDM